MTETVLDHVMSLHTGAVDARHGYEEALQDADSHGLTDVFKKMIEIHRLNGGELEAELSHSGQETDEKGSFMSTIHRTIMSIRSLFGGLDQSVLPGLIDGEERNVAAYEKALHVPDIDAARRQLLTTQRDRLQAAITDMRAIERAHADS